MPVLQHAVQNAARGTNHRHAQKYTAIGIDNPTTQGRLCIKGMNAHQHALNSSRITRPLLKKNGEFMPVSWEEALNHIKDQVTMIQTEHGHDAMAVYGSASITNEEAYLLGSSHE